MAVVLLVVIIQGLNIGKEKAQAEIIYNTADNLVSGLQNFYNDQDRFPSVTEFEDVNIMLNYFSQFPPISLISQDCSQSFVYKRLSNSSYTLNYCLPRAFNLSGKGWNQINGLAKN